MRIFIALSLLITFGFVFPEEPKEPAKDKPSENQPPNDQPPFKNEQYEKTIGEVNLSMKLLQSEYSKAIEELKRRQEKRGEGENGKKMEDVIINLQEASKRVQQIHEFVKKALKDEKRKEDIMPYLDKLYDFEYKRIKNALKDHSERPQSDRPQEDRDVDVAARNEVRHKDEGSNVKVKKAITKKDEP